MMTREEAIASCQPFIVKTARKHAKRGMIDFLDLVQAGNLGVLEAYDRFDESRNNKFFTYAIYWIQKTMQEAIYKSCTIIVPQNVQAIRKKVENKKQTHFAETGELLERDEAAEQAGITSRDKKWATACVPVKPRSLEQCSYITNKQLSPIDIVYVKEALGFLDERSQRILLSYMHQKSLREIGREHSLTQECVRQIINKSVDRLKKKEKRVRGKTWN